MELIPCRLVRGKKLCVREGERETEREKGGGKERRKSRGKVQKRKID